jgi:DNA-binding NarL/FixJ family response regulator
MTAEIERWLESSRLAESNTKVFLIVEFEPLRTGLESAIPRDQGLAVCGAASSIQEAGRSAAFLEADIVLVDVDALNRSQTDVLFGALGERFPGLKVLFLGEMQDAMEIPFETLQVLLQLDTFGFVHKSGPAHRVLEAIRIVATRGFVCESDAIKHVLSRLSQWSNQSSTTVFDQLSEREFEVLTRVVQGRSNKEIARDLFVSEGTVKAHVSHIMAKLNVERRTELVRQAVANGLISAADED